MIRHVRFQGIFRLKLSILSLLHLASIIFQVNFYWSSNLVKKPHILFIKTGVSSTNDKHNAKKLNETAKTWAMLRFPAKSLDSRLETAVILRYTQSKCTCTDTSRSKEQLRSINKNHKNIRLPDVPELSTPFQLLDLFLQQHHSISDPLLLQKQPIYI